MGTEKFREIISLPILTTRKLQSCKICNFWKKFVRQVGQLSRIIRSCNFEIHFSDILV